MGEPKISYDVYWARLLLLLCFQVVVVVTSIFAHWPEGSRGKTVDGAVLTTSLWRRCESSDSDLAVRCHEFILLEDLTAFPAFLLAACRVMLIVAQLFSLVVMGLLLNTFGVHEWNGTPGWQRCLKAVEIQLLLHISTAVLVLSFHLATQICNRDPLYSLGASYIAPLVASILSLIILLATKHSIQGVREHKHADSEKEKQREKENREGKSKKNDLLVGIVQHPPKEPTAPVMTSLSLMFGPMTSQPSSNPIGPPSQTRAPSAIDSEDSKRLTSLNGSLDILDAEVAAADEEETDRPPTPPISPFNSVPHLSMSSINSEGRITPSPFKLILTNDGQHAVVHSE